jgi:hypothetical protein
MAIRYRPPLDCETWPSNCTTPAGIARYVTIADDQPQLSGKPVAPRSLSRADHKARTALGDTPNAKQSARKAKESAGESVGLPTNRPKASPQLTDQSAVNRGRYPDTDGRRSYMRAYMARRRAALSAAPLSESVPEGEADRDLWVAEVKAQIAKDFAPDAPAPKAALSDAERQRRRRERIAAAKAAGLAISKGSRLGCFSVLPSHKNRVRPSRIVPDSIDGLTRKSGNVGDGADCCFLAEHIPHGLKLAWREARLPAAVQILGCLGVFDAGLLRLLRRLGLGLRHGGHERDQAVADGHLHRVLRCAVETQPIDDRLDDHPSCHELPNDLCHVRVVAAKTVDPSNNQHVSCPQHVEQSPTFRSFAERNANARHAFVGDDAVDCEACRARLRLLVGKRLLC